MRAALLALPLAALAGCLNTAPCVQPPHPQLTAQPLGDPCTGTSDCATGLACLRSAGGLDEEPAWGGLRTCSHDCGAAQCPANTACVSKSVFSDGGVSRYCVPTCSQDSDCQATFTAAGKCTDAGVTGYCERIFCQADSQCPAGFACEHSVNACCTPGSVCVRGGLQIGYCRRT